MRTSTLRVLIFLTVALGGGSLLLLVWFLSAGPPLRISIARSDPARLGVDALLCFVFFLQHSGMVRRGAKERLARRVPAITIPALYSIASGIALVILVLLWQPTDDLIYRLDGPARWIPSGIALLALAGFVWGVVSLHGFDPFGTSPLRGALHGAVPASSDFVLRGPYRLVRHPLYLFVLILIWCNARLSTDLLLFDVLFTAWIIVGTLFEERDLLREFGPAYREYQRSVPMLLPVPRLLRHGGGEASSQ